MRRLVLVYVGVALLTIAFALLVIGPSSLFPRANGIRMLTLPTHTGNGIDDSLTFIGQPFRDVAGECVYYMGDDGSTILPIWPPGYVATLGGMTLNIWRPDDPPDHPFNAFSEVLEFHGEGVAEPYEQLRPRLTTEVPEPCRMWGMLLVAETIQRTE